MITLVSMGHSWSAEVAMKDEYNTGQRAQVQSSLGLGEGDGEDSIVFSAVFWRLVTRNP